MRDSDGDGVPDVLEVFAGRDAQDAADVPLVAARRLEAIRLALAE